MSKSKVGQGNKTADNINDSQYSCSQNKVRPSRGGGGIGGGVDQVPEEVASLVETYLQQSPGRRSSSEESEAELIQPSLQLDIWDYGGQPDLNTGHLLGLIDHRQTAPLSLVGIRPDTVL